MKCHFKWSSPPRHKYIELLVVREPGQPEPSAQGGSTSAATSQQGQGGRDHQILVNFTLFSRSSSDCHPIIFKCIIPDAHQHDDEQEIVEKGDGFLPLKDLNQLPSTTMW